MVLGAQFIQTSDYHDTRIFKVEKGTGMCTVCSGEISDACFFKLAEESFAVNRDTMWSHRVHAYYRFKDDILL